MPIPQDFEVTYKDRRITVTACPPLNVAQGAAWWVRIDDNWIRIRDRKPMETGDDASLEEDVRAFVRDLFLRTGEHTKP